MHRHGNYDDAVDDSDDDSDDDDDVWYGTHDAQGSSDTD